MEWLAKLAPLLGTALGGPLGGAAAGFIADKLGMSDKTVESVAKVLEGSKLTSDQVVAMKAAEIEFKRFLETNKIDIAALDVKNTQGARDMFSATRSLTPSVLTYLVTIGFFGILIAMIADPNIRPSEALLLLLGALSASFGAAINFWLGSSHSSDKKSVLLAQSDASK
jgi:hypothetical protein